MSGENPSESPNGSDESVSYSYDDRPEKKGSNESTDDLNKSSEVQPTTDKDFESDKENWMRRRGNGRYRALSFPDLGTNNVTDPSNDKVLLNNTADVNLPEQDGTTTTTKEPMLGSEAMTADTLQPDGSKTEKEPLDT